MDNIIPMWIGKGPCGFSTSGIKAGFNLNYTVEAEQNDMVGPLTDGASRKTCAQTQ